MSTNTKKNLSSKEKEDLLHILKTRFDTNTYRHKNIKWDQVEDKLLDNPDKLWSLQQMEVTGGEPDVISYDTSSDQYLFFDCSKESPLKRRSLCYDLKAWESRKANKPKGNAEEMALEMGVELLTEAQYRELQKLGTFDSKTSSWLKTPEDIRTLGGAIFGDNRFDTVFIYHNGAESYYAARGFRGVLIV